MYRGQEIAGGDARRILPRSASAQAVPTPFCGVGAQDKSCSGVVEDRELSPLRPGGRLGAQGRLRRVVGKAR